MKEIQSLVNVRIQRWFLVAMASLGLMAGYWVCSPDEPSGATRQAVVFSEGADARDDPSRASAATAGTRPEPLQRATLAEPGTPGSTAAYGFVLDEDGQPVPGASVVGFPGGERLAATSDNGEFSFRFSGGGLVVRASHDGRVSAPAAVSSARQVSHVLQLQQALAISVKIVSAKTREPLANADVELSSPAFPAVKGQTGRDGWVHLTPPHAASLLVVARCEGHGSVRRALSASSASTGAQELTLSLPPRLDVRGSVVTPAGEPAAAVSVNATEQTTLRSVETVVSDDRGRFRMALFPGLFRFTARGGDRGSTVSGEVRLTSSTQRVDLVLDATRRVRGRVVSEAGEAVADARVWLQSRTGGGYGTRERESQLSGSDGSFSFVGVSGVDHWLQATWQGRQTAVESVSADPIADVELRFDHTMGIGGSVRDPSGQPSPGAIVQARRSGLDARLRDAPAAVSATADGEGRFELRDLSEGRWDLYARAAEEHLEFGREAETVLATVEAGRDDVVLQVRRAGAIEGWIEMDDGTVPTDVLFIVSGYAVRSASGGSFLIQGIPEGEHLLRVTGSNFATVEVKDVEVRPRETTWLGAIQVSRGRTLSGVVRSADGHPVAGASVLAAASFRLTSQPIEGYRVEKDPASRLVHTDAQGAFRLRGLGPEVRAVMAEHPSHGRSALVPVASTGNDSVELRLEVAAQVGGTISLDGDPQEGFAVIVSAEGATWTTTSGPDGRYLLDGIPSGRYRVVAADQRKSGGVGLSTQQVMLEAGERRVVDFSFSRARPTVRVWFHEATPEASAFLRSKESLYSAEKPDAELAHEFAGVVAGNYQACVVLPAAEPDVDPTIRCEGVEVRDSPELQELRL